MSLLASKSAGKMKKPSPDASKLDKPSDQIALGDQPSEGTQKKSPFDVFQSKQKTVRDWDLDDTVDPFEGETKSPEKEHEEDKYEADRADLTSINPLSSTSVYNSTTAHAITDAAAPVDHSSTITAIRELADKILDEVYEMKKNGDTSTIVTIKNMPLFNDARIVLTTSSNAANEYNIAFENLRPDAKQLIDQNINTLRLVLDDNSNVNAVHILTTTTLIEHALPGDNKDQNFGRGNREDQNEEEQRRQQKEKNKG